MDVATAQAITVPEIAGSPATASMDRRAEALAELGALDLRAQAFAELRALSMDPERPKPSTVLTAT